MGTDHFFRRNVDFKATRLRQLVGLEMKNTHMEVTVGARRAVSLTAEVLQDVELLEWEIILAEYTISVIVRFQGDTLMYVEQHAADAGPLSGSVEVKSPGVFELIIDNSFSLMRDN